MSSKDIYTPITPTYLYIKQHSITGLKYFGKTCNKDPYKYIGSGTHWTRHIKKHGKEHIVTLWVSELYYDTSIVEPALNFSIEKNIVESLDWANLKPENGLDGGSPGQIAHNKGKNISEETKAKISKSQKGKFHNSETKAKISSFNKNKIISDETRAKMSARIISDETRAKMSASQKGKHKSDKHKEKISTIHKGKIISEEHRANMSASRIGKKRGPYKSKLDI